MENKEIIDLELSKGAKKQELLLRGITKSKKKYWLLKWIRE